MSAGRPQTLTGALGLARGGALALVGCGGKTSVAGLLAGANRQLRVLVSPTARIRPMAAPGVLLLASEEAALAHTPGPGVVCCGLPAAQGKLCALPPGLLAEIAPRYDLVLMEADGSRGLPCKGWADYEPVVPPFATHTVGVVTTLALGRPADDATVHRLPLFTALTGAAAGAPITLAALAAMVGRPQGMFRSRQGRAVLLINQVENEARLAEAKALAAAIRREYPGAVEQIWAGSALADRWRAV